MKNGKLLGVVVGLSTMLSCSNSQTLVLTNPLAVDRVDEAIVLSRATVEQRYGAVADGLAPVVSLNNAFLPSQVDDLDGDGKWDEFVFVANFKASEALSLSIKNVSIDAYPTFNKRTNVRLGIKQEDHSYLEVDSYEAPYYKDKFKIIAQGESVSWENDKMGFRNYFDCRNLKDLFGKLKPDLVLDKISTPEIPNYHVLSHWGMDVLHCGSSLGAGGLAMMEDDSLYRLGSTETYSYQKVVEGPVRSIFDLKYTGWKVADVQLSAVERITIYPGKYWFQSDVTVSGFDGEKQLVTGIVTSKLDTDPVDFMANADFRSIATLGKQSENKDELGMAVMLKNNEVVKVGRTTDINFYKLGYKTVDAKGFSQVISETYYVSQKIMADKVAQHYFFSVWGLENDKWKSIEGFETYISAEAENLSNPIVVAE